MNNVCLPASNTLTFVTDILLHSTILYCFLTIFFIFYASSVMKSSIENEIDHAMHRGVNSLLKQPNMRSTIKAVTDQVDVSKITDRLSRPTNETTINHQMVYSHAIIVSIVLVMIIILVYMMARTTCNTCIPIVALLQNNAILFACVAIIEILFFKFIIMKYAPVEPSYIVKVAIDELKNSAK